MVVMIFDDRGDLSKNGFIYIYIYIERKNKEMVGMRLYDYSNMEGRWQEYLSLGWERRAC